MVCYKIVIPVIFVLFLKSIKCLLSFEECWNLGFDRAFLQRSSCHLLDDYGLEKLKPICEQCSEEKSDLENYLVKVQKVVLEYCSCKFEMFPQVKAFIENFENSKQFPNLKFQHIFGINPRLKLYDEHNHMLKQMDIHKWDTDAITEYLQSILH